MKSRSFIEQIRNSRGELLYLVRGQDQGKAAWYYLEVDKLKLPLLEKAAATSNGAKINLEQYGKVQEYGWGENPPEELMKKKSGS